MDMDVREKRDASESLPDSGELSRRDFLKLSAIAGGATVATLYGLSNSGTMPVAAAEFDEFATVLPAGENEKLVHNACSPNDVMGCPHLVTVRDGRVVNTTAAPTTMPDYRRICLKGLTHAQRLYQPDRIKYPMKCVGGARKGEGDWVRIDWDEALDTIADKMKIELAKSGKERGIMWGFGSGNYGLLNGYLGLMKFIMNVGGTFPIIPNIWDMATMMGYGYALGGMAGTVASIMPESIRGLVSRFIGGTYDLINQPIGGVMNSLGLRALVYIGPPNSSSHHDWGLCKYMMVWGASMFESMIHEAHFLTEAMERGMKLCVVDPRFSSTAAKADTWVPLRPGSDVIFGLSMINVIIEEELYDDHFVKEHTVGPFLVKNSDGKFLKLIELPLIGGIGTYMERDGLSGLIGPGGTAARPTLFGEYSTLSGRCKPSFQLLADEAAKYPPDVAAELCGIPADLIRQVARDFATSDPAGIHFGLGPDRYSTGDMVGFVHATLLAITGNFGKRGAVIGGFPLTEIAGGLFKGDTLSYMLERLPAIMDFMLPTIANENGVRVKASSLTEGLSGLYFGDPMPEWVEQGNIRVVYNVISNFLGNQIPERERWVSALNKVDLIVTSDMFFTATAEMSDIVLPAAHWYEQYDVTFGLHPHLVARDRVIEPLWECKTDWWIYSQLAQRLGFGDDFPEDENELLGAIGGEKWDKMKREGMLYMGSDEPYAPYSDYSFATESGRISIYNENLVDVGKEIIRGAWPLEAGPESPEAAKYPIVLNTQHGRWRVHSTYSNTPLLREINPEPLVEMNGKDARDRKIKEGDLVKVWNDRGKVVLKARISEAIQPGMLNIQQGWWPHDYVAGHHQNLSHQKVDSFTHNFNFFDIRVDFAKTTDSEILELQRHDEEMTPYMKEARRYKNGWRMV